MMTKVWRRLHIRYIRLWISSWRRIQLREHFFQNKFESEVPLVRIVLILITLSWTRLGTGLRRHWREFSQRLPLGRFAFNAFKLWSISRVTRFRRGRLSFRVHSRYWTRGWILDERHPSGRGVFRDFAAVADPCERGCIVAEPWGVNLR